MTQPPCHAALCASQFLEHICPDWPHWTLPLVRTAWPVLVVQPVHISFCSHSALLAVHCFDASVSTMLSSSRRDIAYSRIRSWEVDAKTTNAAHLRFRFSRKWVYGALSSRRRLEQLQFRLKNSDWVIATGVFQGSRCWPILVVCRQSPQMPFSWIFLNSRRYN